jgi:hypothetical protein
VEVEAYYYLVSPWWFGLKKQVVMLVEEFYLGERIIGNNFPYVLG